MPRNKMLNDLDHMRQDSKPIKVLKESPSEP